MKKGLLEEILQANNTRPGSICTVKTILDNLSPEDADSLQQAIDNPLIKATAISRALKNRNIKLSDSTVTRHRRKECCCES